MKRYQQTFYVFLLTIAVAPVAFAEAERPSVSVTGTTWCRQVFQLQKRSADELKHVELKFVADGVVSIYLNGQRLCRQHAADNKVLSWNVGSLIRDGRNSLAVSIATQESRFAFAVRDSKGEVATPGQWKVVTVAPPVGWQTTDFNDRDWKAASLQAWQQAFDGREEESLAWKKNVGDDRNAGGKLKLADGDHVVLLGGTFFERAQQFGYLETALNVAAGEANVTFRNLGWSGDTVFAESRGIFDSPERGYERMVEHVRAEEPDVILVNYGQNESMSSAGSEASTNSFRDQLSRLHNDLSATGAHVVYLTPHPFVDAGGPLPDASRWNSRLEQYSNIVTEFATSVGSQTIDLFSGFTESVSATSAKFSGAPAPLKDGELHAELQKLQFQKWTDNGLHWNDEGYRIVSDVVATRTTGHGAQPASITVNGRTQDVSVQSGEIRNVTWDAKSQSVTFEYRADALSPAPTSVRVEGAVESHLSLCSVRSENPDGPETRVPSTGSGTTFLLPNSYDDCVALTVRKNELYFHRWRPQNITYLYGFRKHEQGNNASEMAQFDPLIKDLEEQIHQAKSPRWQRVTLSSE